MKFQLIQKIIGHGYSHVRKRRGYKPLFKNGKFLPYIPGKILFLFTISFLFLILSILVFNTYKKEQQKNYIKSQAYSISQECTKAKRVNDCFVEKFIAVTNKNELPMTLAILKDLQKIDYRANACHFIAHQIATFEIKKNPKGWLKLFREFNPQDCGRGYFHGLIEGYTLVEPGFNLNKNSMYSICQSIINSSPGDKKLHADCMHTLGHLLLVQASGNLGPAITICTELDETSKLNCSYGVFMENIQRQNLVAHGISKYLAKTEQEIRSQQANCTGFPKNLAGTCWRALTVLINKTYNFNEKKLFKKCNEAGDKANIENCYFSGIGHIGYTKLTGYVSSEDLSPLCKVYKVGTETYGKCLDYLMYYLTYSSNNYDSKLKTFCDSISNPYKERCVKSLSRSEIPQKSDQAEFEPPANIFGEF